MSQAGHTVDHSLHARKTRGCRPVKYGLDCKVMDETGTLLPVDTAQRLDCGQFDKRIHARPAEAPSMVSDTAVFQPFNMTVVGTCGDHLSPDALKPTNQPGAEIPQIPPRIGDKQYLDAQHRRIGVSPGTLPVKRCRCRSNRK